MEAFAAVDAGAAALVELGELAVADGAPAADALALAADGALDDAALAGDADDDEAELAEGGAGGAAASPQAARARTSRARAGTHSRRFTVIP